MTVLSSELGLFEECDRCDGKGWEMDEPPLGRPVVEDCPECIGRRVVLTHKGRELLGFLSIFYKP